MSTKTTFKRVALVAVAAMGFGLLSVAPSSAAQHVFQADTFTTSAATSSVTVGSSVSVTVTMSYLATTALESMTVTSSFTSTPTGATLAELPSFGGFSAGSNTSGSFIGTGSTSATMGNLATAGYSTGTYTATFAPVKVGTYVIALTPTGTNAAGADTVNSLVSTAKTWTVTVNALASAAAADATSTSIIAPGIVSTGSADTAVSTGVATGSVVATIKVTPLVASATATGSNTITATITGPGTLGIGTTSTVVASLGRSITNTGGGSYWVFVYGDGTTGTSTITISLGSVVVGTETVNFYGAAASAVATVVKPVIAVGSTASTGAVTVLVKDAAGNTVPGATVFAQSGTTTVFASSSVATGSTGIASFDLTALTAGTSSFVFSNVAAGSTAVYTSAAVSVRAGTATPGSVVMSLDKATYTQGEAATLTIMVKDAAGNAVADGSPTVFLTGGVTSTRALSAGTLPATTALTVGSSTGTLTYAINVPTTSGDFTISASAGSGLTGTFSVTATVSKSAAEIANADAIAAAADAAAEATDAANAATDAANAAAEAADAATAAAQDAADAVATLGTQVAELVAGLKAQIAAQKAAITALTNLVIKIQKKLKA